MHYARWSRHGDLHGEYGCDKKRIKARTKVVPSGCWEFQGNVLFSRGLDTPYGRISKNGKMALAHRFSYEAFFGPIPAGLLVLHGCDNPLCANPEHLFLGTHKDNMQDMQKKGRTGGFCKALQKQKELSQ